MNETLIHGVTSAAPPTHTTPSITQTYPGIQWLAASRTTHHRAPIPVGMMSKTKQKSALRACVPADLRDNLIKIVFPNKHTGAGFHRRRPRGDLAWQPQQPSKTKVTPARSRKASPESRRRFVVGMVWSTMHTTAVPAQQTYPEVSVPAARNNPTAPFLLVALGSPARQAAWSIQYWRWYEVVSSHLEPEQKQQQLWVRQCTDALAPILGRTSARR